MSRSRGNGVRHRLRRIYIDTGIIDLGFSPLVQALSVESASSGLLPVVKYLSLEIDISNQVPAPPILPDPPPSGEADAPLLGGLSIQVDDSPMPALGGLSIEVDIL